MSKIAFVVTTLFMMAAAPAAMANHHGKPHGEHKQCHHKMDPSVFITSKDKEVIQYYLAHDYKEACAKGTMKCPSVYGKKSYAAGKSVLENAGYRPLPGYVVHDLQPVPNGYHYGIVGNDVVLVFGPHKRVIDSVSLRD